MSADQEQKGESWKTAALRAAACAGMYGAAWAAWGVGAKAFSTGLFMSACVAGGWDLAKDAWETIRQRRLDIHFLMLTAALASGLLGHWQEAALLLVLFSGSEALEAFANHRTETALSSLFREAPRTALRVMEDGTTLEIAVDALQPGMSIRIPPGQQVPVDVRVTSGNSDCDESTLTGEAIPVGKRPGDEARGGVLNLSGLLTAEVLRPASQSALQQIMELIQEARGRKARAQRFTDRFGTRYTTLVLAGCTLLFLWWWLGAKLPAFSGNGVTSAFQRAVTILIVASPCALVLSVPSAILAAIASGARHGVIFRGGSSIEDLATIDTLALDKTGTLTTGELAVEEVHVTSGTPDILQHAAWNLARQSTHPLSRAIARHFTGITSQEEPQEYTNHPGSGVSGMIGGGLWRMGKRSWIGEYTTLPPEDLSAHAPVHSEVWVHGPGATGNLWLKDEPRTGAAALLEQMHRQGLHTVMLTGDREEAAAVVARLTGVQEVHAGLLPAQKTEVIQGFIAAGKKPAMVGDGVNDAPALAAATVGVAMGLRGSDAALAEADVVLSRDRLEAFLEAWHLSRRAVKIMRQNVFVALGTAGIMVITGIIREVPLWLGVLTHEGSTALVVLNSMRLLFGKYS